MASQLKGSKVHNTTDNQYVEKIMTVGSGKAELRKKAILLHKICWDRNIHLSVEWVSRDQNVDANLLSHFDDPDDYKLGHHCVFFSIIVLLPGGAKKCAPSLIYSF